MLAEIYGDVCSCMENPCKVVLCLPLHTFCIDERGTIANLFALQVFTKIIWNMLRFGSSGFCDVGFKSLRWMSVFVVFFLHAL